MIGFIDSRTPEEREADSKIKSTTTFAGEGNFKTARYLVVKNNIMEPEKKLYNLLLDKLAKSLGKYPLKQHGKQQPFI